jgi:3-phosphoshikimate 1-carboxyvinyltransferase
MVLGLSALGIGLKWIAPATIEVTPGPLKADASIDVGLAGTVMRFLPPLAALANGTVRFHGSDAASRRPIKELLEALASLGVKVDFPPAGRSLPFSVSGSGRVNGSDVELDASASSQFLSALLLAGPRFERGLTARLCSQTLPSQPHINMTLEALTRFGANARQIDLATWSVDPGGLSGRNLIVEPDLSNAAPFLAAALVAGGRVSVCNWPEHTSQPGDLLRTYLEAFGATVSLEDRVLTVSAPGLVHGPLRAVQLNLASAGELTPCLAALATLADGQSELSGIAHLRGHETDRLAALANEITALGGQATITADGLTIRPAALRAGVVRTYGDHRMAQFGAILGLAVDGIELDDVCVTAKTLPAFPAMWTEMTRS